MFLEIRVECKVMNRCLFVCLFVFLFLFFSRKHFWNWNGDYCREKGYTLHYNEAISYMLTLLLMKWGHSLPDLRDDGGGVLVVGKFHVNGFQHLLCVCVVLNPFQEGEPPWTAGHLDRGRTRYTNIHTHAHWVPLHSTIVSFPDCCAEDWEWGWLASYPGFSPPTKRCVSLLYLQLGSCNGLFTNY